MMDDELTEFYPLDSEQTATPEQRPAPALETVTSGPWTTSRDHVALQFFWQGYDAYVTCKDKESVAPCFYNAQCVGQAADAEFVQIVPVEEVRERHILDEMRVQLVSVSSGKYLRATHVSKYLKWSKTRDEQTVFLLQIADRKPLTSTSKFTLTSCFWPERAVGFTQTFPLGGGREINKAIGFLTLEKRKNQVPLLFPIRFRAVPRAVRDNRSVVTNRLRRPTPFVTATEMLFIGEEDVENVSDIPLARVASSITETGSFIERNSAERLSGPEDDLWENCTFCGMLFRVRGDLVAHIRDCHGEMLHRVSVPGAFCTHCGTRRVEGRCTRCNHGN
ncbi:Cytochrome c oxidase copper chaperone [Phytophthora boehmeriae]|uniref:Cytochrome c oxidase copper chaperone n=1 Tax=Phytophthora boehmeriae TaxID=109152 RepID=A0A8T1XCC7_9STRA|nr:Cytochrome c oxidase copper chaperone [Phytophthora boehmeriae]